MLGVGDIQLLAITLALLGSGSCSGSAGILTPAWQQCLHQPPPVIPPTQGASNW